MDHHRYRLDYFTLHLANYISWNTLVSYQPKQQKSRFFDEILLFDIGHGCHYNNFWNDAIFRIKK